MVTCGWAWIRPHPLVQHGDSASVSLLPSVQWTTFALIRVRQALQEIAKYLQFILCSLLQTANEWVEWSGQWLFDQVTATTWKLFCTHFRWGFLIAKPRREKIAEHKVVKILLDRIHHHHHRHEYQGVVDIKKTTFFSRQLSSFEN